MYSSAKCKKCRHVLLGEKDIKATLINAHSDILNEECLKETCPSVAELICLSEDKLPDWIIVIIQENNWSKGKINCRHCSARLGAFDFVSGIKCGCKSFILPPVHLIKSKVDLRFRFCGDADCPDWVLVEINMLSTLSSVKLKLLAQVVANGIIKPPIDMSKSEKLFADSKLDLDLDLKACVACLSFIITSTVRYNCDRNVLHSELQQLGLPREHSTSIRRVTDDHFVEIKAKLATDSLRVNPLRKCSVDVNKQTNCVEVNLEIGNNELTRVMMTPFTLNVLLENLKGVKTNMKELHDNPYVL